MYGIINLKIRTRQRANDRSLLITLRVAILIPIELGGVLSIVQAEIFENILYGGGAVFRVVGEVFPGGVARLPILNIERIIVFLVVCKDFLDLAGTAAI